MNEQPMTRREAREQERLRAALALSGQTGSVPVSTGSVPISVDSVPEIASSEAQSHSVTGPVPILETVDDFHPVTGPIGILEPKSLVLTEPTPDVTNLSVVLPESGATLTTGAIDLPWLKGTETEELALVEAGSEADKASAEEVKDNAIEGIEPVAARVHERTRRRKSVFPDRLRKGWGVVHLVLVSAFVLFAIFCALLASIMLGIIKL